MFSTAVEESPEEELAAEEHLLAPEYTTTTTAFEPKVQRSSLLDTLSHQAFGVTALEE